MKVYKILYQYNGSVEVFHGEYIGYRKIETEGHLEFLNKEKQHMLQVFFSDIVRIELL